MLYTTLRILRKNHACRSAYALLRASLPHHFEQDEPIPLIHGTSCNSFQDILWAFHVVHPDCESERNRIARLVGCEYAEAVLPILERYHPGNTQFRKIIDTSRRFACNTASLKELFNAETVAWYMASSIPSHLPTGKRNLASSFAATAIAGITEQDVCISQTSVHAQKAAWHAYRTGSRITAARQFDILLRYLAHGG